MAKVLIVDDSRVYRYSLRKLVKDWGHEVIRSEDTDRIWGLRQDAAACVTKPIKPEIPLTAITEAKAA